MFLAVVPAYNEERRIESVVLGLLPHVDRVCVVDDSSTDATAEYAGRAGAVVLTHCLNRGQGAALETGHAYARSIGAELVLHFDADGQFDPADIAKAKAHLLEHDADILFGSRFLRDSSDIPFLKRAFLLPLARLVNRLSGAPRLSDAHNGFRILTRRALEKIVITQDRMAHATEIPVMAKKYGLRSVEYPVTVRYERFGQGLGGGISIVKDIIAEKLIRLS